MALCSSDLLRTHHLLVERVVRICCRPITWWNGVVRICCRPITCWWNGVVGSVADPSPAGGTIVVRSVADPSLLVERCSSDLLQIHHLLVALCSWICCGPITCWWNGVVRICCRTITCWWNVFGPVADPSPVVERSWICCRTITAGER